MTLRRVTLTALTVLTGAALTAATASDEQFRDAAGQLRVALVKQPFVPNGTSVGPTTMADGGIHPALKALGAAVRVNEIKLTADQEPEMIFSRYPKASAIGVATIPNRDEGGLSLAAVNRMILGAVRGLNARR